MSEQTANLCTTDACESLRARLAKYEDSEGRPVVDESWRLIKNKELRNVERLRSLSNHLRQCAHCAVKPDISIDGSGKILMFHDCLAFENRRIVKVSGDDKHIINTWENLTFPPEEEKTYNIAALKAQPSDVIVPAGVTLERDFMGTMHIKVGDFDFIQIQYQYPYTDNSGTWKLAERIATLLNGGRS
jgi:hypothetical protein